MRDLQTRPPILPTSIQARHRCVQWRDASFHYQLDAFRQPAHYQRLNQRILQRNRHLSRPRKCRLQLTAQATWLQVLVCQRSQRCQVPHGGIQACRLQKSQVKDSKEGPTEGLSKEKLHRKRTLERFQRQRTSQECTENSEENKGWWLSNRWLHERYRLQRHWCDPREFRWFWRKSVKWACLTIKAETDIAVMQHWDSTRLLLQFEEDKGGTRSSLSYRLVSLR